MTRMTCATEVVVGRTVRFLLKHGRPAVPREIGHQRATLEEDRSGAGAQ